MSKPILLINQTEPKHQSALQQQIEIMSKGYGYVRLCIPIESTCNYCGRKKDIVSWYNGFFLCEEYNKRRENKPKNICKGL